MQQSIRPLVVIAALFTSLAHADVTTTGDVSPDPTTILPAENLTVGNTATGTMLIDTNTAVNSQTAVTNAFGLIATLPGSTGTVTVAGDGASWINSDILTVGRDGHGILNIQAGATVSNADASISNGGSSISGPYGSGSVTVTGPNSTWTTDRLTVGGSATGTLNIEAGASVSTAKRAIIGEDFNSTGITTVTGPESNWDIINRNLTVGLAGTGTLNIENGGTVSSRVGYLGTNNEDLFNGSGFGVGTATVTGPDSKWTNTGLLDVTTGVRNALFIGGNDDAAGISGTLNILDSGTVEAIGVTRIWGPGTVNLNGGTLTTESLDVLGAFNFSQGTLNLTNSSVTVGTGAGISGFFESTLVINPAMAVNVTNGPVDVAAGGSLLINGSTASFSADGGANEGAISAIDGSLTYTTAMTQTSTGTMNLINATVTGGVTIDPGSHVFVANTATFNPAEEGDTFVNNGEVNVGGTATFNLPVSGSGDFTGSGTNVFNSSFSPGSSPALVRIEGNAKLVSSTTLILELAGTTLGSQYDHLDIAGLLTADGTLDIKLLSGFTPQLGDTFDLLDFGSLTGTFSKVLLPTLNSGMTFDTSSLLTTGSIAVVPEPTTIMSLTLLILASLCYSRSG